MLSSGLRNWQQDNKFRVSGDTVYGVYENVGFSVAEEDGGRLFIFMLSGSDEAFDRLEDLLCNQSGALRNAQVGDVESYLALFFDDADGRLSGADMSDLLDYVAGSFRSCGFRVPNVCVKCGAPATKRAFYNDMVQPLCGPCREADKLEKAHKAAAPAAADRASDYDRGYAQPSRGYDDQDDRRPARRDYDERSYNESAYDNRGYDDDGDPFAARTDMVGEGSAPSGFLGALLGSVAGLVLYAATALITGLEFPAVCFASGLCAVLGYIAFGGLREKKFAMISTLATSIVLSIVMVLVFGGAVNGFSVMFGNLFKLVGFNLLMGVAGAFLGVMIVRDRLLDYLAGVKN